MHKHARMILLEVVFVTSIIGIVLLKGDEITMPTWWEFIVLGLATMRIAQTLSFNEIAEPLRAPFCVVEKDSCGAGDNVAPKNGSVIGSLLACPICTGTWSALILFALWVLYMPAGIIVAGILGLAGLSEILHYLTEVLSWGGRFFRVMSGAISPDDE